MAHLNTETIKALTLPSVHDVSNAVYHKAWLDRSRAVALIEKAERVNADTSLVRMPGSWAELNAFVGTLKALLSRQKGALRRAEQRAALAGTAAA